MFIPDPIIPTLQSAPFDDPEWIYEIKHDGFRALAVIEHGQCRFFSRKKHKFTGYQDLPAALVKEVHADAAILDGELVVTDHLGRTMFADLLKQRELARYFAFDLLWLNGEDLMHMMRPYLSLPCVCNVTSLRKTNTDVACLAFVP